MINVIIYVCSTLLTYFLGVLNKKHNWNLPIPIQNIFVGIGTFLGAYVAHIILQIPINMEDTVQQIIVALGGAGTATLGYDTSKVNK